MTAQRAAAAAALNDSDAAIRIQCRWRGYATRKLLHQFHGAAICIQRLYRGHSSRRCTAATVVHSDWQRQTQQYNHSATTIQRYYKGYYIRKYICNIAARHRYIAETSTVGDQLLLAAHMYHQHRQQEEEREARSREAATIDQITANIHHLISTRVQASVFAHPYGVAELRSGRSVEAQIQHAFQRKQQAARIMRANIVKLHKTQQHTQSTNMKYRHTTSGATLINNRYQPAMVTLPDIHTRHTAQT